MVKQSIWALGRQCRQREIQALQASETLQALRWALERRGTQHDKGLRRPWSSKLQCGGTCQVLGK